MPDTQPISEKIEALRRWVMSATPRAPHSSLRGSTAALAALDEVAASHAALVGVLERVVNATAHMDVADEVRLRAALADARALLAREKGVPR